MTRTITKNVAWVLVAVVTVLAPMTLLVAGAMSDGGALSRFDFSGVSVEHFVANAHEVLWGYSGLMNAVSNTLVLCLFMVIFQVSSSILAAYAFAFFVFPRRQILFVLVMITYLLPAVATVIPLFFLISDLGLKGTPVGILLPYLLFSPYAVYLLRDRFQAIPRDILAQAQLDGLGAWGTLFHVALPLVRPFIWLISLITFVSMWNAFLWPNLIAGTRWPTVTVALSSLQGQYGTQWNLVLAGTLLALIPAVTAFIVTQRQLVTSPLEEIEE